MNENAYGYRAFSMIWQGVKGITVDKIVSQIDSIHLKFDYSDLNEKGLFLILPNTAPALRTSY